MGGACSTHGGRRKMHKTNVAGKSERKKSLGTTRRKCEDNIRMDLREIQCEVVD